MHITVIIPQAISWSGALIHRQSWVVAGCPAGLALRVAERTGRLRDKDKLGGGSPGTLRYDDWLLSSVESLPPAAPPATYSLARSPAGIPLIHQHPGSMGPSDLDRVGSCRHLDRRPPPHSVGIQCVAMPSLRQGLRLASHICPSMPALWLDQSGSKEWSDRHLTSACCCRGLPRVPLSW